jgi:hypothetical protein
MKARGHAGTRREARPHALLTRHNLSGERLRTSLPETSVVACRAIDADQWQR